MLAAFEVYLDYTWLHCLIHPVELQAARTCFVRLCCRSTAAGIDMVTLPLEKHTAESGTEKLSAPWMLCMVAGYFLLVLVELAELALRRMLVRPLVGCCFDACSYLVDYVELEFDLECLEISRQGVEKSVGLPTSVAMYMVLAAD